MPDVRVQKCFPTNWGVSRNLADPECHSHVFAGNICSGKFQCAILGVRPTG